MPTQPNPLGYLAEGTERALRAIGEGQQNVLKMEIGQRQAEQESKAKTEEQAQEFKFRQDLQSQQLAAQQSMERIQQEAQNARQMSANELTKAEIESRRRSEEAQQHFNFMKMVGDNVQNMIPMTPESMIKAFPNIDPAYITSAIDNANPLIETRRTSATATEQDRRNAQALDNKWRESQTKLNEAQALYNLHRSTLSAGSLISQMRDIYSSGPMTPEKQDEYMRLNADYQDLTGSVFNPADNTVIHNVAPTRANPTGQIVEPLLPQSTTSASTPRTRTSGSSTTSARSMSPEDIRAAIDPILGTNPTPAAVRAAHSWVDSEIKHGRLPQSQRQSMINYINHVAATQPPKRTSSSAEDNPTLRGL